MLLLGALDDIMLKILMACAIIQMVTEKATHDDSDPNAAPWYVDGLAIWLAVAVVSLVTAISDYQKEGEFLKKQMIEENSKVVIVRRDQGNEITVHRNYIKVGDIIKVVNGMNIPVDGVVLEGIGIMSDESAMTGESDHLPKESMSKCLERRALHESESSDRGHHDVPSPILLSGTQINTGEGWFMCIVVGEMTCEGQILSGIKATSETTPLQDKLEVIATDIGKLGMLAALLIFHVLLLRQFIEALLMRRFDLSGGPRMYYEFRLEDNVSGVFGAMIPEACADAACEKEFPNSKYKLVDNPDLAAYKDMTTARCFGDPDVKKLDRSDE
jgi:magnesium-transporting ATPase (P-type)